MLGMPRPAIVGVALAIAFIVTQASGVRAETPVAPHPLDARQARLEGLSKDDLARIAPELESGPVVLVEFADADKGQLPAINVALPVRASPESVARTIAHPSEFPRFMPTLDSVKIVAKHENSIVYDWAFDLALFHLRGRNTLTVYEAPKGRPDAGQRITIDSEEGDLGRGRILFRVHARGSGSLLVVSLRLDLREANYVARQVAKAARSVNRSANLALAFSMATHIRNEAERQVGLGQDKPAPQPALVKPLVDVARWAPLLNRGDLLLFRTSGTALQQIAVIGLVAQDQSKVQEVMHDAKAFGSSLVPGSKAEVVAQSNGLTTFDWAIPLPLVGVSGQMTLLDGGSKLTIDATQGALLGGRWIFELSSVAPNGTLVIGWAHFDFDNSSWLLEKLVSADPYLGQGMIGASQVMLMRAVRTRATAPPAP
jgi:hypothetical protein